MLKVFISSTYKDLKEYRKAVIEQLERMRVSGIKMEYFGAHDSEPTNASLEELDGCNVYVGIFGQRFGALSPDKQRSVTQCEYERAVELHDSGKISSLLLYVAGEGEVDLPASLRESDAYFEKQQTFRRTLRAKHTPQSFASPHELASWVAADLYRLQAIGEFTDPSAIKIFRRDDWAIIRDEFDTSAEDRLARIRKILDFLTESFAELFEINPKRLDVHPLFKRMSEELKQIIPGISLDDEGGILRRAGVRHVIFRAETALTLLKSLNEATLIKIGEQIGKNAASDLVKYTVETKHLIPDSAEAFVSLWDYWDRTGGWGKLKLTGESRAGDQPVRPSDKLQPKTASRKAPTHEWRIRIENNFVITRDKNETHDLCKFWCGYIKGLLNEALPGITKAMMTRLDQKQRESVTLPAYHRVAEVVLTRGDRTNAETETTFCVRFEAEHFTEARKTLSDSERHLQSRDWDHSIRSSRSALLEAKNELGKRFSAVYKSIRLQADNATAVRDMLAPNHRPASDKDTAERWFKAANLFVQEVSVSDKSL